MGIQNLCTSALIVILSVLFVNSQKIDSTEVKCLVCQATVQEMQKAIGKIDPKKMIDVGNFRFDDDSSKMVPYVKSEIYLTELMENICDKMDDYAKATYKDTGRLTVLKLMTDSGGMNPDMSKVDFIQDGDLNKSLKHFCLEVLEDNEEHVLSLFSGANVDNMELELCSKKAGYCNESDWIPEEEYQLETDDESKDEL